MKPLEEKIEAALQAGESRRQIVERLKKSSDPQKLLFHANNISNPAVRGRYQYLNLLLALLLLFITTKKLLTIVIFGAFDLLLVLNLVVPIINFYLLREILRFRRLGYQFLFVLSLLSLLHPENRLLPELPVTLLIIGLAGWLQLQLFPRSQLVKTVEL